MADGMPPELIKANARLAEVFGVGITVQTSNMGDYRTSAGYATLKGIPTLAAEMGMGGWVTGDSVRATREATHRVLKHTGVLPHIATVPGEKTRWTRINGGKAYVFAPMDGYFERRFALGEHIEAGQLAGLMHALNRPNLEPEPVYFQSGGTLYAHGLIGHVRAGQNLAVLVEDVAAPL
jgi:predicted deacylase